MADVANINRYNWFQLLPPELDRKLRNEMVYIDLDSKSLLFEKGTPTKGIYLIEAGNIKCSTATPAGKEVVVGVFGKMSLLADAETFCNEPHVYSASALKKSRVGLLKKHRFEKLRLEHPEIGERIIQMISLRLTRTIQLMEDTIGYDVPQRLARQIDRLSRVHFDHANNPDEKAELIVNIGQETLAAMIGAATQTTNRILKQWEAQGLIKVNYGNISIYDLAALLEFAKGKDINDE